jgi:hypothetical protein
LNRISNRLNWISAASLLAFITARLACVGATLNLKPVADTMIMEVAPTNNAGALAWFTTGGNHYAMRSRGLIKFDIAGNVPAGAIIIAASLTLSVTGVPGDGYAVGFFDLHRLLRTWGEGTNNPTSSPGQGTLATTNEATWLSPLALTTNHWSSPGAASTNDYVPAVSASQIVYDVTQSPYIFPDPSSDPAPFIADLQLWLDHAALNFGWIFICESEDVPNTVRRFGSREDPIFAPQLQIQFVFPPHIDRFQRNGQQLSLFFTAVPGQTYRVQYRDSVFSGAWQTLATAGPFTSSTQVVAVDSIIAPQRFYRLSAF